jgi:hypothetical protein
MEFFFLYNLSVLKRPHVFAKATSSPGVGAQMSHKRAATRHVRTSQSSVQCLVMDDTTQSSVQCLVMDDTSQSSVQCLVMDDTSAFSATGPFIH